MPMNTVPTPQELALLAGLSVSAQGDVIPATEEPTNPNANAEVTVETLQAQLVELQAAAATTTETLATANARVAELEAAATEAETAHAAALAAVETTLAEANATIEALSPAVRNSVKGLAVPLNKTVDPSTLSGQELAKTYTELSAAYIEHFKQGKQTKTPPVVDDKEKKAEVVKVSPNSMLGIAAASLK